MIQKIILAVVVGVVTALVCILVGTLLISLNVPVAASIGVFLKNFSTVIGLLAGVWYYFTGQTPKL